MDFQQRAFDWLSRRYASLHHFDLESYSLAFMRVYQEVGSPSSFPVVKQAVFRVLDDSVVVDYVDSVREPLVSGARTMDMYRELFAHDYWMLGMDLRQGF